MAASSARTSSASKPRPELTDSFGLTPLSKMTYSERSTFARSFPTQNLLAESRFISDLAIEMT